MKLKRLILSLLFLVALSFLTINCTSSNSEPEIAMEDTDGDGISDNLDDDDDNDTILDIDDNCPLIANTDQADSNNDGIGDVCQDTDNDGILDIDDNCIETPNAEQQDTDGDGIGDVCDVTFNFLPENCVDGMASVYPCNDYDLLLHIPLDTFDASRGNDSWGWTDTTTGKEYALMGLDNGVAFIDITIPSEAVYIGKLPTATENSIWRDVKVFKDHAYIVSEATNHGMQIFDLTRLRTVTNTPETFTADRQYNGFGSAHNIVINEDSGYAYPVGTSRSGTFNGGPLFININDPKNPIDEGGYGDDAYSHDAQVVTYKGPDTDYIGSEILIGSNENEIAIVDVSDKANPRRISTISYSNVGYTHQGWFTENQQYFILGDELDEQNFGGNTRTLIFDFTDLDNPSFKMQYDGTTNAIDHNGYVKGNNLYLANYSAGVRIIDITNISNNSLNEIGFFDTHPSRNGANFDGVWNVYPYFDSENLVISDINSGLFVVKKK